MISPTYQSGAVSIQLLLDLNDYLLHGFYIRPLGHETLKSLDPIQEERDLSSLILQGVDLSCHDIDGLGCYAIIPASTHISTSSTGHADYYGDDRVGIHHSG